MGRLTALLLLSLFTTAARAQVLSLPEVERRAVSAGAGAARAKIAEAEAELDIASSGRRPSMALSTDASVAPGGQFIEVESTDGGRFLVPGSRRLGEAGAFSPVPRFGCVLSMQANLFDFGRTASRIRAAERRALAARAEVEADREGVVRLARDAYLAWAVAYARAALAERHLRDASTRFEMLEALVKEGTRPQADKGLAEQERLAVEIELSATREELDHAQVVLAEMVGGAWTRSLIPDPGILEGSLADRSGEAQAGEAPLEQRAAAAAAMGESFAYPHAPVISASADAGVRGQAASVFPAYRVGVTVTVPLWDGGLVAAQARAARARAEGLRAEAAASLKAHHADQVAARSDREHAQAKLRFAERLRNLAEDQLRQEAERYRLGAADLRVVFEARERLSRAEVQVLGLKAERARAMLRARP